MKKMIDFLNKLEEGNIAYSLIKVRDFSITVVVKVPTAIWEVDFFFENNTDECTEVWVEKFYSDGTLFDESELQTLLRDNSD